MDSLPLSAIIIKPNRQRQEFEPEALQELKNSIEDRGLMHPLVLRKEADGWVLVAGERRLKAIKEIFELGGSFNCAGTRWTETVPFTNIGDLTDLEAEECELDENLRRRDLTWQEHAAAVAKLHNLRQKQAVERADKAQANGTSEAVAQRMEQHTVADTALELTGRSDGAYQDNIRKEIIVARHLSNPDVAGAKSADEAFKILKRQEERTKNVALAVEVGKTFNADKHLLLNMSCLDYMRTVAQDELFDVICTDPPYGMNAQDFADAGGKMTGIEHHYDDTPESWRKLMAEWAPLSFAVCKPQAHAYVFCDFDRFHELKGFMQAAGWYVFRTPLIIKKVNSGRVPLPDQGPRRQYELVLYAIKGKKTTNAIYSDVIESAADENLSHGAQKPVAVYQNLLMRSVKAGDRVADFFCGTGPIFEAAHGFKCTAVGTEQAQEYYAMSLQRIQRLKRLEEPALF